jgi:hypothetical protein
MKENTAIIAATKIRLALMRGGHIPIPLFGKEPPIYGKNNARKGFERWQMLREVSSEMIEMWGQKIWPEAINTGVLGTRTPGLDIDILTPDAADAVERLVRERFEEHGEITVRFGLAPKRLIPLRTDEPFAKMRRVLIAPDGTEQKIEILADGAQFVCDGTHPQTHERYRWFGRSLDQIPREELPYAREADMKEILDAAAKLLVEDFGFSEKSCPRTNDGGPHESGEELQASVERIIAALAVIPNGDLDWDDWNRVGMAAWRATNGADAAFCAFDAWSKKSRKYDGNVTAQKWTAYSRSPPTQVGAGTIFFLADRADPNWWLDYLARKRDDEQEEEPPPWEPDDDRGAQPTSGGLEIWDAGDDPGPIPPRQWLLGNQFCRSFISSIVAAGGVGKTALRLLQFISLATGRNLCGQHVFRRCRVLLISLEDDRNELQRRIKAVLDYCAEKHLMTKNELYNINRAELKGWFFCSSPKLVKLAEMQNRKRIIGPLEREIRVAVLRYKPDLLSFDPFIKTHALEENSSGDMDFVCDLLARLGIEFDIAVDSPHHVHKGLMTPGDADSGRGSSGIKDVGRLVYTLVPMSEGEAAVFQIDRADRRSYVRLDSAKVNIAAHSAKATWFHIVGQNIGNGTREYPNGDTIQVVEPWNPPDAWKDTTADGLNAILNDIAKRHTQRPALHQRANGKGERAWGLAIGAKALPEQV